MYTWARPSRLLCFRPITTNRSQWLLISTQQSFVGQSPPTFRFFHKLRVANAAQGQATDVLEASSSPTVKGSTGQPHKLQPVDYTALAACAAELQRSYCPSVVDRALQASPCSLLLRLRTLEAVGWLRLNWNVSHAHVSIQQDTPQRSSEAEGFSFGQQVEGALKGCVLANVTLPNPWDRILQLSFSTRLGESASHHLYCEIMGRHSNVILTTGATPPVILAAAKQVGSKMTQQRFVQTGRQYTIPPAAHGLDPGIVTNAGDLQSFLTQHQPGQEEAGHATVHDALVRCFNGISPSLAHELFLYAGVRDQALSSQLDDQQWVALFEAWQGWLNCLSSASFGVSTSGKAYSMIGSYSDGSDVTASPLEFMHIYYGPIVELEEFERIKHKILHSITATVKRLRNKCHSLQKQAARSTEHSATQKTADLIMSNLYNIPSGATSIEVEDWDTQDFITIELDPLKPPAAVAEALYAKARKERRGVAQVAPLLEAAEEELVFLQETELQVQQLESSEDLPSLLEVESVLIAEGYLKAPAGTKPNKGGKNKAQQGNKKAKTADAVESFRQYTSPGGFRVLIGRNSRQNEELTLKKGKENDVWMHARGVPGAHLLLCLPAGQTAGDADIAYAADLAAYFSKARAEGKVEVTCASPSDIKKPKGAKTGQVLVMKETVVVGRPHQSAAAQTAEE